MAVTVAEGEVVITADGTKIPRQIARDIDGNSGPIDDAGKRSGGLFGAALGGSFLGNFAANTANQIVGAVGEAIGTGLRAAVDFAIGGIDIASGLNEATTALDTIFGSGSAAVQDFGKTTAKTIGQSRLDSLKAAQSFGVYGKAAGLANEDNAAFSTGLVSLASDFASFYDADPSDVIAAIGSGLRGEAEPLRQYGVLLDDAALKNRAMSMGIFDGNGSLTQQQKVLAAHAEIMAQGSIAQGDFAKTSDGLANQQRILSASLEDAQGKLGEALLPAMLSLTEFANDELVPMLTTLIETVGPMLGDALTEAAPAITEFFTSFAEELPAMIELGSEALPVLIDALAWLIPVFVDISQKFATGAEQWGAFFGKLGEGAGQISDFFASTGAQFAVAWGQISTWFAGVFGFFGEIGARFGEGAAQIFSFFGSVGASFATGWAQISSFFGLVSGAIGTAIGEFGRFAGEVGANIGTAISWIAGLPGRAMEALGDLGRKLFRSGQDLIGGFIDGIKNMMGGVGDAIGGVLDFAAGFFPNSPAERGPFSGAGWTAIENSGGAVMTAFASGFARPDLTGALRPAFDALNGGNAVARPSMVGAGAVGGMAGGGVTITVGNINEANDPLGTPGRIGREMRKWKVA